MPWPTMPRVIGTKVPRLDAPQKATGRAKYSFDMNINREGARMLHGRILRCPYAHARVKNIDTTAAEKITGYRAQHLFVKAGAELFFAGAEVIAIAADRNRKMKPAPGRIRSMSINPPGCIVVFMRRSGSGWRKP